MTYLEQIASLPLSERARFIYSLTDEEAKALLYDFDNGGELVNRSNAKRSLLDFTTYTFSGYQVGAPHRYICKILDKFLDDCLAQLSPRLLLFMPPRHGKSELVSRRLPAYALGRNPDMSVISTSYGADLASRMNRDVQRIIDSEEYRRVFPETGLFGKNIRTMAHGHYLRNSDIFEIVGRKGVYRSSGIGGGITGMGFDLGIMDDPIKDAEQAYSETYRNAFWEWYLQVFRTRAQPGAGIIGIWTRWHADDAGGRLLEAAKKGGDQWQVVSLPAIAVQKDVLGRLPGEALWPEKFPLEALMAIKNAPGGEGAGSHAFAALYQQDPEIAGGNIFKREWWKYYRELPAVKRIVQSWDTAFKKGQENDFSCNTTWGFVDNGYPIIDFWKEKVEYPELKRMIIWQAEKHTPDTILIEDKASGQSLIQDLQRNTRLPIKPIKVDSDKITRAHACSALVESGRVLLPENAPWVGDYVDSMAAFPSGPHDDDVDSSTQFLNWTNMMFPGWGLFEHYRDQAAANQPPPVETEFNHVGVARGLEQKIRQIGGVPQGG